MDCVVFGGTWTAVACQHYATTFDGRRFSITSKVMGHAPVPSRHPKKRPLAGAFAREPVAGRFGLVFGAVPDRIRWNSRNAARPLYLLIAFQCCIHGEIICSLIAGALPSF